MAESIVILNNPLIFMNESYLKKVLEGKYSSVKFEIIDLNEIPQKIIFIFKDQNLSEKFISEFNDKFFDDKIDYKLNLEKSSKNVEELKTQYQNENKDNQLTPYVFHKAYQNEWRINYSNSQEKDGLVFINEEERQLGIRAVKFLVSKFGENLLSGKSILNISLPVFMFDKRTLHEAFAWEQAYAPYFLTRAFYSKDKLERLKWITTHLIGFLHLSVIQIKPFNPIIGETFQCRIGNIDLYVEHTVNHPITANFYAREINGNFTLYGYQITDASINLNSVTAERLGHYYINFNDGTQYMITIPKITLRGLTLGDRLFIIEGKCVAVDLKNNLCAFIEMNPEKIGYFASFFTKKKTFPDHFEGKIVNLKYVKIDTKGSNHELLDDAKVLSKIEGDWTSSISFDGEEYWNIDEYKAFKIFKNGYILESNGSNRPDLKYLIEGKEEESQTEKENLEVRQRQDRKLRQKYMEEKK